MHIEKITWGGLQCHVVHSLPAGQKPRLAVVLSHGYGAPGSDLVGLAQALFSLAPTIAQHIVFIFPAACLDLAEKGLYGGRAWWPVDLDRLINRRTPELLAHFRCECPVGLPEARAMMLQLLDQAGDQFGLSCAQFVIGGFSQGAMLATDVALRLPQPPAALCIFSGALVNEREWRELAQHRSLRKVLQSHGRFDSILPFSMGTALCDLLRDAGGDVDFVEFNGDHEIPPMVLHRLANLLARLVDISLE